uniref:NADH dehydrogenase subunit 4 n=1 Tax=Plegadiphilus threskiornis TaxID=2965265 RepID=UPI0026E349A7|nr:NADH dehydrogenase subunit 4 [Plegadiphilus threskiornis]WIM51527.1 NADH dehydrogenase subunit 4 [Plegadiphilus threskiornis]
MKSLSRSPMIFNDEILLSEMIILYLFFALKNNYYSWEMPNFISTSLFTDKMSSSLLMLTFWITMMMYMTVKNEHNSDSSHSKLLFYIMFLCLMVSYTFQTSHVIGFFFMYESTIIPTMLIILGWGGQPEKVSSALTFFFYMFVCSIPFLGFLIYYSMKNENFSMTMNYQMSGFQLSSSLLVIMMMLMFLVKMPMFTLHYWLPKAHVEAPVYGSMVLAGILLKMGGYGLVRFMWLLGQNVTKKGALMSSIIKDSIMSVSLIGASMASIVCLTSADMKKMVAFSSISHMNLAIAAMMTQSSLACTSVVILMISHGLTSSNMFSMVDNIYKRSSTRSILMNKSLSLLIPVISFMWMVTLVMNMAIPPSLGSFSEIIMCMTLISFSEMTIPLLMSYIFLSGFFSMYFFHLMNHGGGKTNYKPLLWPMSIKELSTFSFHMIPSLLLILYLELFSLAL